MPAVTNKLGRSSWVNLVFSSGNCCFWPITSRGFFSELLISCLVGFYATKVNQPLVLLVSSKSFLPGGLIANYINPAYIKQVNKIFARDLFATKKRNVVVQHILYNGFLRAKPPYRLFKSLWLEDSLSINMNWSSELLSEFSRILNDLLLFPPVVLHEKSELDFSSVLNEEYVALHVRRGDKLASEASYIPVSAFFKAIPALFKCLPVIIITDDYSVYREAVSFSKQLARPVAVYTTCPIGKTGYDNSTFSRSTNQQKVLELNSLLLDFSVAVGSAYFVGTYSSNVGRAVYISRNGERSSSLDGNFRFIW